MKLWRTEIKKNSSYGISKDHLNFKKIGGAFDGESIECKSKGSDKSQTEQNLKEVKPYLRDLIDDDHRQSGAWKI